MNNELPSKEQLAGTIEILGDIEGYVRGAVLPASEAPKIMRAFQYLEAFRQGLTAQLKIAELKEQAPQVVHEAVNGKD